MKTPSHSLFWLLLSATTVACGGSPGRGQDAGLRSEVRDSAGIRIVENASAAGHIWREIDPEPLLEIPPVTGDGELLRIVGAHRLSDGSLVVASAGTFTVGLYDPQGTRIGSFGRQGAGPGEFERLGSLLRLPADSFGVWDGSHARLSVFSRDGLARETSFTGSTEGASRYTVLSHAGNDTWLVRPAGFLSGGGLTPVAGLVRDTARFSLIDRTAGVVRRVADLPAGESLIDISMQGQQIRSIEVRLLPVRRMAAAVMADTLVWAMSSDRWEIEGRTRDGSLADLIRLDEATRPFPPSLYGAMKADRLADLPPGPERDNFATAWDTWPVSEWEPVIQGLRRASDGSLWAERYAPLDTMSRVHVVFDGEGKVLGEVRLPPRFRTMDIGPDWILGVWQDEDDLEWVRMYRLSR